MTPKLLALKITASALAMVSHCLENNRKDMEDSKDLLVTCLWLYLYMLAGLDLHQLHFQRREFLPHGIEVLLFCKVLGPSNDPERSLHC